jgi:hypothetical protein
VASESLYANRLCGWAQQSAATDGRHALVDGGPRLELFDLASDPREETPLPGPGRHPAFEALDRALHAYRARGRGGAGGDPVAPEGSPYGSLRRPVDAFLPPAENRRLRDVREGLPDLRTLARADAAVAARDPALVSLLLPELRRLAGADPANPAPCLALGRALLLVAGEPAEAVRWLREAASRGYASAELDGLIAAASAGK